MFDLQSKVKAGDINDNDGYTPTLDQTVISDDVIQVMKLVYDIDDDELEDLSKDDDVMELFWHDIKKGAKRMKEYVKEGPCFPHLR